MSKFSNLIKITRFIKPYWGKLALSIAAATVGTLFSLFSFAMAMPFLKILFENQEMVTEPKPFALNRDAILHNINYYISNIIADEGQVAALGIVSVLILIFVFFKTSMTYMGNYLLAPIRTGIVRDIRDEMYRKILDLQLAFFSEERKGDIISRMTGDVQEIERSVMKSIKNAIKAPITIIMYFVSLMILSWQMTLFVLILLPLSGLVIGRIGKSLRKKSLRGQRKLGVLLSYIEETLFGLTIIKAFNGETSFAKRFGNENNRYSRLMKKVWRRRDLAGPLSEYLSTIVIVVVMYYGGMMVLNDNSGLSPEAFITYLIIFSQIIPPAKQVSNVYYNVQRGMASVDRVRDIMSAKVKITEKTDAIAIADFKKDISYSNVYFRYTDKNVLKNINLDIPKGDTVALVGQSGAGKSTLANLLPRFYDVTEGQVTIDGIDLREYKIQDLRDLMGIVTQESILFNDTIYDNIAFGITGAKEEDVVSAAKIANAHAFIVETEHGYQTNIGDRGSKLSGGQRQRISIARAILKNPPILILDEATSSLDTESESLVKDAMEKLMSNRTSLIIAHRLSTIQNADKIVVMEEGEIVESGTHNELLDKQGVYAKLYSMQVFE